MQLIERRASERAQHTRENELFQNRSPCTWRRLVQGKFKDTGKGEVVKGLDVSAFATSPPVIL